MPATETTTPETVAVPLAASSSSSPPASLHSVSQDSTRPSTAVSLNASAFQDNPSISQPAPPTEEPPLPAFLRQSRPDIHAKFVDLEWQQRNRLAQGMMPSEPVSQWARLTGDDVMRRNRYANVEPFDGNRIRLKVPEGHSDYINASPIVLNSTRTGTPKNFIATQGPKKASHSHIWRMIWHETASPAVIVMLTQTHEAGREKCFQYFPRSLSDPALAINEHDEFADGFVATVTLLSLTEDAATRSTIREMELRTRDGAAKRVWHLLFAGWPDFLVPEGEDRAALLRLVALSAAKNEDSASPRVVHCSAGVGRSGTFIALDWLLGELDEGCLDLVEDEYDPVAEVVDRLRQQRMMMVQGEQQFSFLYDVLKVLWIERWRQRSEGGGDGQADEAQSSSAERP